MDSHDTKRIDTLLGDPSFRPYIVQDRRIPAKAGTFLPFPADLSPRISGALQKRGIEALYSHQVMVWNAVRAGNNVVVVTPTASGKTLCYNLPVVQALLEDEQSRALYLFPTKALSQDQQSELTDMGTALLKAGQVLVYDGDTPESIRARARESGRIIISNPDMLHAGILPNHPKWIKFFSHLKYIVIDEAHSYRGVFGSHAANVLRRLKRIAAFYGAHPRFILCSATIANPLELACLLTGEHVQLIDESGAPSGEKRIILYNPPLIDALSGLRRSVVSESRRWMVALLKAGIKTILFAHSRVKTELAAAYVNEDLANIFTDNSHIKVEAYRAGLLPLERREIEKGLREGRIQGVVSTNALELGIDIGGLDASVLAGFPGSFNSFWQQAGRSGRRGGISVSVFIANMSALDQFIMNDPQWFFHKSAEEARLDADNPYILADHGKCAAFELPFKDGDSDFGPDLAAILESLEEAGIVRHTAGKWHWADRSYPAEGVSLRSSGVDNVVIIDVTKGRNTVIGEMDRPSAKELIFKSAVYIHRGCQYLVENLDIQNRRCLVREAKLNYFTDGVVKVDLKVLSEDEVFEYPSIDSEVSSRGVLCDVLVRSQAVKFMKIRFHTHENIGYGDIDLPQEEIQTRALVLLFPDEGAAGKVLQGMDEERRARILKGLAVLVKMIAPLYLLCDERDLGLTERVRDPHFETCALYIYDKYAGGTGLSEALSRRVPELYHAILRAIEVCPCQAGCPSCVGPGNAKADTRSLLSALVRQ
ncbi:DEAD/DEAH box helicase [Breznakiellaceae bacterium SP9]